jgi:hypothetical protein
MYADMELVYDRNRNAARPKKAWLAGVIHSKTDTQVLNLQQMMSTNMVRFLRVLMMMMRRLPRMGRGWDRGTVGSRGWEGGKRSREWNGAERDVEDAVPYKCGKARAGRRYLLCPTPCPSFVSFYLTHHLLLL